MYHCNKMPIRIFLLMALNHICGSVYSTVQDLGKIYATRSYIVLMLAGTVATTVGIVSVGEVAL